MRLTVKEVALSRGYRNAKELGDAAGIPNVSMYRIWNGTAKRIDLETLEKLCEVLQVQVAGLIVHIPKIENGLPGEPSAPAGAKPVRVRGSASKSKRESKQARAAVAIG
jgi:DNA-binding Xre family transcriptional regulator